MKTHYDVIVVGARAAGAATAMLLARRGLRVLVVDRARYGSDTLSTHALMRPALIQLERWGLLDTVRNSGAPAVRRAVFHYPDERVALDIEPLYAPRRTVLDAILADAAMAVPRPRIVVARWRPDRFEGYVGRIERSGRSTVRSIRVPPELAGSDAEIFVYQVGGEARRLGTARDRALEYTPWKSGVYWILACRTDACFVIAASRQGA